MTTKGNNQYHADKVREWRAKHKQSGLCRYCNTPVAEGLTLCQRHSDYFKVYRKAKKIATRMSDKNDGTTEGNPAI